MKCKHCVHYSDNYCNNLESTYFDIDKESDDGCTVGERKQDSTTIILVLNVVIAVLVAAIGYLLFK